jgi:hypothetical protein
MKNRTAKGPVQACWIPTDLHKELRVAAAQDELRIGDIVETLVRNWLVKRHAKESK